MRSRRHARALVVLSVASLGALGIVSGCGSDGEEASPDGSSSGASGNASSSSGGTSSSSSSGTASSGGSADASIPDVQFAYDAPMRPDSDACAETTAIATLKPLDMFVMLDRSGSMNYPFAENSPKGDCNVGQSTSPQSRWCASINALSAYFKSSAAAGNAAALQFFFDANLTVPASGSQCNAVLYSSSHTPGGTTGFTALPSSAFDGALNALKPDWATPMEGAVRGIVGFTGRAANQRAGRTTIGVLITDGDPTNLPGVCDGSVTNLRDILQAHYNATGIRTFVIGMTGATFSNLETIATGGNAPMHGDTVGAITDACGNGAGPCRHFNVGDGTGNALAEALNQIQGLAIACQYAMPKPAVGAVNPNDVSVDYLLNGVPPAKSLTRVTSPAACVADGWYYDDNASPTTITLCPAQCAAVQNDPGAKISVSLGCLGG
jgi:hypothetical protein